MSRSKRASIDLGTNTCLCLIAECDSERAVVTRVIRDLTTVVRLGQGVDVNRELVPEAMERTLAALKCYAEAVRAEGIEPGAVVCVATSQARDARNGAEFFGRVERETGFRFRTISGDEEARFTFLGGLLPGMKPEEFAVVDIGGGSTELMSAAGGQSLDVGSVRFTERYLKSDPVTDDEFWACQDAIDAELSKWSQLPSGSQLLAVAGTATTLAAWHLGLQAYDASMIDACELTRGDVHRMVEELKWRTIAERRSLPGMEQGREDVMLAGAMILWRAMELLGLKSCRVSTRGLRFGVLFSKV